MPDDHFVYSSFVRAALSQHRPVVALETTLVTHGLPQPQGVETASALEAEVVAAGATPATVGVLDGTVRVGLTLAELHRLADSNAVKLGLSNFAAQVSSGKPGSTTVAATLFVCARSGIEVFATGGIGGVHRGAAESGDVSADLFALARYPVAVVCSGAKAVLDLARTVEALESLGVPVYGFGTEQFPAFYLRESGLPVDRRLDSIESLARTVRSHFQLGLGTGVVIANPIPREHELPRAECEQALARAVADAAEKRVRGRDVTPFLLERLAELTGGAAVAANLALLKSNARVAGALAVELARQEA
ncbi:MAG TPA: pseudouridine-5'-phosphate glycosidase [Candidatus Eisenbacteria bacterium]|jgi:pseudouridine-5'-phosphate glycosidase